MHKAKVIAVLAKHYKVEMLEGAAAEGMDSIHKYLHDVVVAYEEEPPRRIAEASGDADPLLADGLLPSGPAVTPPNRPAAPPASDAEVMTAMKDLWST